MTENVASGRRFALLFLAMEISGSVTSRKERNEILFGITTVRPPF
jgi:hypothetical protein